MNSEVRMVSDERLLTPVAVLPLQVFEPATQRRHLRAEHQLLLAVLEDAIHIYCRENCRRRLFREAEAWIESRDRSWIFSFERICEGLELDPDYVRRGVRARRRQLRLASADPERASA